MPRPRSLPKSFYNENFKSLAKKQTHHRVKIRLMAMHHIQQGHTYANTAKTYLVNINAVFFVTSNPLIDSININ